MKHHYRNYRHSFPLIRKSTYAHVCVNLWNSSPINGSATGKKLVHKIEPIFNNEKTKMRIFLEDGSLAEYAIHDLTTAEVRTSDRTKQLQRIAQISRNW